MNINPIIETALAGLTFNGNAVSVEPIIYTGTATPTAYITYTLILDKDGAYADDEATESDITATVDIFCKGNHRPLSERAKTLLKSVGFTIQGVGPEQYEKDTGYYHVPIDIYMEGFYG